MEIRPTGKLDLYSTNRPKDPNNLPSICRMYLQLCGQWLASERQRRIRAYLGWNSNCLLLAL